MNEIAARALAHYYNLRAQGIPPLDARMHVRLRFGIIITADMPAPVEAVEVVSSSKPGDFGSDYPKTIKCSSTGPAYGC
jgi:hypothetical protein